MIMLETLIPMLGFVLVTTITPGPNNLLLASSGVRFGFAATMPHVVGVHCGVYVLVGLCAAGVGGLILSQAWALFTLKVAASIYLLHLAWQILGMRMSPSTGEEHARPMSVWQAGLFQFSNPKAWIMAAAGVNLALPLDGTAFTASVALCLGFATLGLACNLVWVAAGFAAQSAWQSPRYRGWVNGSLAVLTVLTVALFWYP